MNLVINLDKPKGITSQDAVTKVKRILGVKKAGHAGTLDPIATGVLLVCLGEATKAARFLADLDKEYVALMKLGEKTDTLDAEGVVIRKSDELFLGRRDVEEVIEKFKGTVSQTPPMYSAIKVGGEPLYKLARKGIEIERPERMVNIHEIEITGFDLPWLEIRVSCSKGTYIRTLCDEIGEALGVGAYVAELKRTRIGRLTITDSATLDDLERSAWSQGAILPFFHTIDDALQHLDELTLTYGEFKGAMNGMAFRRHKSDFLQNTFMRLKDPSGRLFAIGRTTEDGSIRIERIFHI